MRNVEVSYRVTESEAIRFVLDPENCGLGAPLEDVHVRDEWSRRGGRAEVSGKCDLDGEISVVDVGVDYPGLVRMALARVMRREPKATMHVSIRPAYASRTPDHSEGSGEFPL